MSTAATVKTGGYTIRLDRVGAKSGCVVVERPENEIEDHALTSTRLMPLEDAERVFWDVSRYILENMPDIGTVAACLGYTTVVVL